MSTFTAQFDPQDLKAIDEFLSPLSQRAIKRRVINRVASQTKKRIAAEINTVTTLPKSKVNKSIRVVRASQKNLSASIIIKGRRFSLRSYKGGPNRPRHEYARVHSKATKKKTALARKTYRYEINRGDKKVRDDIFVQRLKNAGLEKAGKFKGERNTALPLTRWGKRYQYTVAQGPSVPGLWQGDEYNDVRQDIVKGLQVFLRTELSLEANTAVVKKRAARRAKKA
jgi:hypothetical protein